MEWGGATNDFIPYPITRERADAYAGSDLSYEFVTWAGVASEHLVMCKNGMWEMAVEFLAQQRRVADPHHVTFVRNPLMDDPASGLVGDAVHWLSGITTPDGRLGRVDVESSGFGLDSGPVAPSGGPSGTRRARCHPSTRTCANTGGPTRRRRPRRPTC